MLASQDEVSQAEDLLADLEANVSALQAFARENLKLSDTMVD